MTRTIEKISILGTGKMGSAVGRTLAKAGVHVVFGSRTPVETVTSFSDLSNVSVVDYQQACAASDCVVIAVPWANTLEMLEDHRDSLSDKVIIDMTNPTSPDWSCLETSGDRSAAETIASTIGSSRVVKAFNGITADNFTNPEFSGEKAQSFICGNDDQAKSVVKSIVNLCGYKPIDCGSLEMARYLEPLAMLWVQLAFWEDWGSEFSFKLIGSAPELG